MNPSAPLLRLRDVRTCYGHIEALDEQAPSGQGETRKLGKPRRKRRRKPQSDQPRNAE